MLFSNRYELAVRFAGSLVPRNPSLQILSAIKVVQKKDTISYESTDIDTFLRVRLPIWGNIEGEYAVSAKSLLKAPKKIATKISDGKISFGSVSMASLDLKEFPSLETRFFTNPVWEQNSFSRKEFVDAGKRACNYVATDISRLALTGVYFRSGFLYATNGHYLLRYKINLKAKGNIAFIIPCAFFRMLQNPFVIDDEIDISIHMPEQDKGYIVARGMSFELVSRLINTEYPDIEKAIPKVMPYSFQVERQPFLDVVNKAATFSNNKSHLAEIIPENNGTEFKISAIDKDGGTEYSDSIKAKPISKKKWDGIAFNAESMSVILSDSPGGIVTLKAGESQISAITIEPQGHDELFFLLMPLRKIDEDQKPESDEKKDETKTQGAQKNEVSKDEVKKK